MTPQEVASLLLKASLQPDYSQTIQQLTPHLTPEVLRELVRRISDEQLRNSRRALQFVEVAEQVAEILGTASAQGLIAWVRGNVLYYFNRYNDALACFQKAEAFYRAQGDDLRVAGLLVNQVSVYTDLGDYSSALSQAVQARARCETAGQPAESYLANLEMTTGWIYEELGQPDLALATYERGREIFVQQGNHLSTALIDVNRANALAKMDQFAEAEVLLQAAITTFRAGGYDQEVARAEFNWGMLARRKGQYQDALRHLGFSHHLFSSIPIPSEVANVDLERSITYGHLHLFHDMLKLAISAEKTFRRAHLRRELNLSLLNQGIAYQELGLLEMAEHRFRRARRYLREQKAFGKVFALDVQRARLYWAMRQPDRAIRLARRVEKGLNPAQFPSLAVQVQLLLAQWAVTREQWTEAQNRLETAQTLSKTYHLVELQIEAAHLTGLLQQTKGQMAQALQHYQNAIRKVQELQTYLSLDELRLGFNETKHRLYQDHVAAIFHLTQTGHASLADLLAGLNLAHSAPLIQIQANQKDMNSPWQSQLKTLRQTWQWYQDKLEPFHQTELSGAPKMSGWPEQVAQLEMEITELSRREQVWLTTTPNVFSVYETEAPEQVLKQLQDRLVFGEILLQYFVVDGRLQVLLVTPQATYLVPDLSPIPSLKRLMQAWRFFIQHSQASWEGAKHPLQHVQTYLRALHEKILAPLQPYLTQIAHLYIVLPPDWHDIPLSALFDGNHYLVETCQVTYLSTPVSLLRKPTSLTMQGSKGLVVGFSDQGRLPHAPVEAQQIAQFFRTEQITSLLEEKATKEAFQSASQEVQLIHLATHALFRPDNPLFSWIRLADERLTVGDLYHLTFPQQPFVVLSACETGKGEVRGGGLFGMGRALLAAGASGLVVTLWPVADQSTAAWMAQFYRYLTNFSPAFALCKAQQEAIRLGWPPYAWAGFTYLAG